LIEVEEVSFEALVDLKARVGYTSGPLLAYGVLGYSWNSYTEDGFSSNGDGLAYGIGLDYDVNGKWFLGAEYLVRDMSNGETDDLAGLEWDVQTLSLRLGLKF
jgi:opacity protein-like surface antigen